MKEIFNIEDFKGLNMLTITDRYILLSENTFVIGKRLNGLYPLISFNKERLNEICIGKLKVGYLKKFLEYMTDADEVEIWVNKNKDKSITLNPLRANDFFLCPILDKEEEKVMLK